jgi:hypothetical protein
MKILTIFGICLLISSRSTFAAEGDIPRASLAYMGLGGMTRLSDNQASKIRGTPVIRGPRELQTYSIPEFRFRLVIP